MRSVVSAAMALLIGQSWGIAAEQRAVRDLEVLLAEVPTLRTGFGGGITSAQQTLAQEITRHGAAAIPPMLDLLSNDNAAVRRFAGYVVRDLPGLTDVHLDRLITAVRAGNGWLPPAIARIGSPQAVKFLLDEFRAKPEFGTQFTWALALCGEKAVPDLLELVRTTPAPRWDDPIEEILTNPRGAGAAAVGGLQAIARDDQLPIENRKRAIRILGALGPKAVGAVADLKAVAQAAPATLAADVNAALTNMGARDALPDLLEDLKTAPEGMALRYIAALGNNGREAGASIVGLLTHPNWSVRVDAARCLGHIGYEEAVPVLIISLGDENDWRLVYTAAESLGRLKAVGAAARLRQVSREHWFPTVRTAAAKAVRSIQGQNVYKPKPDPSAFWMVFFDYSNEGDSPKIESAGTRPTVVREPGTLASAELKRLTYEVADAYEAAQGRAAKRQVMPDRGTRIGSVILLGSDEGEFGGGLAIRDEHGTTRTLVPSNVHGIHQMPFGIVVTTGLAHLGMNNGTTWLVDLKPGADPLIRQFKVLPGAPGRSGILTGGDLYIECNGGDVIITKTGAIRMAD